MVILLNFFILKERIIMANTKKYVSLDKLGLYDEKIKKVVSDGDAASLQSAKDYADSLAVNYDAAGAANTALESAKAYADGKDAAIAEAKQAGIDAAAAAKTADDKAVAAQTDVDNLEAYVGTIPEGATATNIVGYVQEKTAGIATEGAMTELGNRVTAVEGDVATIKANYLDGDDKTELEGKIGAVQTAVDNEKSRAEGIEAGLRTDVNDIKADYLKAADKTELQGNIDTVAGAVERLTNGVSADEVDGVNDLIQYVKDHGPEVTGMQGDIADNAEAIAGVAGRMDTAEGKITAVEGAVATKAEKTYVDEQVEALQGVDTGLGNRIAALEGKFGGADGSVEDMIADAKQEAIDAAASAADTKDAAILAAAKKYADDEDAKIETRVDALETASATHALASDLTALAGRVTTAEGEIDTLQTEMDAVEALAAANKAAHEANAAAIALKASQADLEAVSGRVATLETWHNNFTEVSEEEINALFA
jgi:predicted  nucleic acid-binding Zn-ribbon protein